MASPISVTHVFPKEYSETLERLGKIAEAKFAYLQKESNPDVLPLLQEQSKLLQQICTGIQTLIALQKNTANTRGNS